MFLKLSFITCDCSESILNYARDDIFLIIGAHICLNVFPLGFIRYRCMQSHIPEDRNFHIYATTMNT